MNPALNRSGWMAVIPLLGLCLGLKAAPPNSLCKAEAVFHYSLVPGVFAYGLWCALDDAEVMMFDRSHD